MQQTLNVKTLQDLIDGNTDFVNSPNSMLTFSCNITHGVTSVQYVPTAFILFKIIMEGGLDPQSILDKFNNELVGTWEASRSALGFTESDLNPVGLELNESGYVNVVVNDAWSLNNFTKSGTVLDYLPNKFDLTEMLGGEKLTASITDACAVGVTQSQQFILKAPYGGGAVSIYKYNKTNNTDDLVTTVTRDMEYPVTNFHENIVDALTTIGVTATVTYDNTPSTGDAADDHTVATYTLTSETIECDLLKFLLVRGPNPQGVEIHDQADINVVVTDNEDINNTRHRAGLMGYNTLDDNYAIIALWLSLSTPSNSGATLTFFKLKNIDTNQDHRLELIPVENATLTQKDGSVSDFVDLEPGYGICLAKLPLNPVQHHYSGAMISGLQIQSITVTDVDTGEVLLSSGRIPPEQTQYVFTNSKLALAFDKGVSTLDPETEQSTDNVYLTIVNKQATQKNLAISIRNSDGMPVTGFGTVNLTVGPADAFNVGVNLVPALWGEDGKPQTAVTGQNYPFDIELTYPDVFPTNTITYLGENALTVPSTFTPSEDATVTWGRLEAAQPLTNIDRVWFSGFTKSTVTGVVGLQISTADQLFWWNGVEQINEATLPTINVSVATTFNNQVSYDIKYLDMDTGETVYLTTGSVIPEGYMAGKTRATNLVINSSVQAIESGAFAGWTDCEAIEIKDDVTSVNDGAFSGCTNVKTLIVAGSIGIITSNLFSSMKNLINLTINEGITEIQTNAFNSNVNLSSVQLPNSVITIGDYAFYGLTNCKSVSIGPNVQTIGVSAFGDLTYATSLTFRSTTATIDIGDGAFENWTYMRTPITVPAKTIGVNAFTNWVRCTGVTLVEGLTSVGTNAFNNWFSGSTITLPSTVTTLTQVFQNWFVGKTIKFKEGLTDLLNEFVNFGRYRNSPTDWLTTVNDGIDYGFTSSDWPVSPFTTTTMTVDDVIFPQSLINVDAFNGATAIKVFVFGPNVKMVSNVAPTTDTGATQYFFTGTTPPDSIIGLETGRFSNIYVPDRAAYQAKTGPIVNYCTWVPSLFPQFPTVIPTDAQIVPQPIPSENNWTVQFYDINDCQYKQINCGLAGNSIPDNFGQDYGPIDEVIIYKSVTRIGAAAFLYKSSIRKIVFPKTNVSDLAWIANTAFAGCQGISYITLPDTVLGIGPFAFAGMGDLKGSNVNSLPNLKSCASSAFSGWPETISHPSDIVPSTLFDNLANLLIQATRINGIGDYGSLTTVSLDGTNSWGVYSVTGWSSWIIKKGDSDPELTNGETLYVDYTDPAGNSAPRASGVINSIHT